MHFSLPASPLWHAAPAPDSQVDADRPIERFRIFEKPAARSLWIRHLAALAVVRQLAADVLVVALVAHGVLLAPAGFGLVNVIDLCHQMVSWLESAQLYLLAHKLLLGSCRILCP